MIINSALKDFKIIDVTVGIAGSYATRMLAEVGAQVERPEGIRELYRQLNPHKSTPNWNKGIHNTLDVGKVPLAIDVSTPEGIASLRELISERNILIEDVGLMDNEGSPLRWTHVQSINSNFSVLSVSPFGASGPYKSYAASDLSLWAWSGMSWTTPGIPDTPMNLKSEPPLMPSGLSIPGIIGGVGTAIAVLSSALSENGVRISVSELDVLVSLNYHPVAQFEYLKSMWLRGPNIIARQPNCYLPCKDGWVVLVAMSPNHWAELTSAMGNPEWAQMEQFSDAPLRAANWDALEALLTEWTITRSGSDITKELQGRGLPVYWSTTIDEALASEQVKSRKFIRKTLNSEGQDISYPGLPFAMATREVNYEPEIQDLDVVLEKPNIPSELLPLKGIRVLDFGQYIAAPFAARWLAALGADVIQVESRHNPFDYRNVPPFADDEKGLNRAAGYNVLNAGKRSISLNLKTEKGRKIAKELAATADIIIENYSTGAMDKWGLGFDDIVEVNPKVIYTSIAAFGRTGPLKDYKGLHSIVNAFSGLSDLTGYDSDQPRLLGSYFPDVVSAIYAVFATMTALNNRLVVDKPQHIDLSMTEALMTLMLEPIVDFSIGDRKYIRDGNHHPIFAPHNVYQCQGVDEWVAISARTNEEWKGLCSALGTNYDDDPRFNSEENRKINEDALDKSISMWAKMRTKREAALSLLRFGVPAAPILNPEELVNDPHIVDRGFIGPVDHPEVGIRRAAGIPWRVSGMIAGQHRPAPLVNQHTPKILGEILGYSLKQISDLIDEGVLT
jgi:crotonobetainyl-CoA:carnitine CoA-transferase CaiB-like acyl-CoA transferase